MADENEQDNAAADVSSAALLPARGMRNRFSSDISRWSSTILNKGRRLTDVTSHSFFEQPTPVYGKIEQLYTHTSSKFEPLETNTLRKSSDECNRNLTLSRWALARCQPETAIRDGSRAVAHATDLKSEFAPAYMARATALYHVRQYVFAMLDLNRVLNSKPGTLMQDDAVKLISKCIDDLKKNPPTTDFGDKETILSTFYKQAGLAESNLQSSSQTTSTSLPASKTTKSTALPSVSPASSIAPVPASLPASTTHKATAPPLASASLPALTTRKSTASPPASSTSTSQTVSASIPVSKTLKSTALPSLSPASSIETVAVSLPASTTHKATAPPSASASLPALISRKSTASPSVSPESSSQTTSASPQASTARESTTPPSVSPGSSSQTASASPPASTTRESTAPPSVSPESSSRKTASASSSASTARESTAPPSVSPESSSRKTASASSPASTTRELTALLSVSPELSSQLESLRSALIHVGSSQKTASPPPSGITTERPTELIVDIPYSSIRPLNLYAYSETTNITRKSTKLTLKRRNTSKPFAGRKLEYLSASGDFEPARMLALVEPYATMVKPNYFTLNCSHCAFECPALISCPDCPLVMYCCIDCRKQASMTYHRIECEYLQHIVGKKDSVFEMLTLRALLTLTEQGNKLKTLFEKQDPNDKFDIELFLLKDAIIHLKDVSGTTSKTDDYNISIYFDKVRTASEDERIKKVVDMLYVLKEVTTFYEPYNNASPNQNKVLPESTNLAEIEIFVGCLLAELLLITQYCSHGLKSSPVTGMLPGTLGVLRQEVIGYSIFPILVFFRQSCDPNAILVNFKRYTHIYTMQPIKKDQWITLNFGEDIYYWSKKKEDRMKMLQNKILAKPKCKACDENWPSGKQLKADTDKKLPGIFSIEHDGFIETWRKAWSDEFCSEKADMEKITEFAYTVYDNMKQPHKSFAYSKVLIERVVCKQLEAHLKKNTAELETVLYTIQQTTSPVDRSVAEDKTTSDLTSSVTKSGAKLIHLDSVSAVHESEAENEPTTSKLIDLDDPVGPANESEAKNKTDLMSKLKYLDFVPLNESETSATSVLIDLHSVSPEHESEAENKTDIVLELKYLDTVSISEPETENRTATSELIDLDSVPVNDPETENRTATSELIDLDSTSPANESEAGSSGLASKK